MSRNLFLYAIIALIHFSGVSIAIPTSRELVAKGVVPPEQIQALASLYTDTAGAKWIYRKLDFDGKSRTVRPWGFENGKPKSEICADTDWDGVKCECDSKKCDITELDLVNMKLTGKLPTLAALPLTTLKINDNPITEALFLGKNNKLVKLYAGKLELTKALPVSEIITTNKATLVELDVSFPCYDQEFNIPCRDSKLNNLGSKVADFSGVTKLAVLIAQKNFLTVVPKLPSTIVKLDLSYNDLDAFPAPLPATITSLSYASTLVKTMGGVYSLTKLVELNLQATLITSVTWASLPTTLQILNLNKLGRMEKISSTIPDLASLTNLKELDLSNNALTGPLPSGLFSKSRKALLKIALSNQGPIGPDDKTVPSLTGNLPTEYPANLQQLLLDQNGLDGDTLPAFKTLCPELQVLNLGHNAFTGSPDPASLKGNKLKELNLESNKFSAEEFPAFFDDGCILETFSVAGNAEMKGNPLINLAKCDNLKILDLGSCGFTGEFNDKDVTLADKKTVRKLSQMTKMTRLKLNGNDFSGTIPVALGAWKALQFLSLDNNNFSGDLEKVLADLREMRYLYLQGNKVLKKEGDKYVPAGGFTGGIHLKLGTVMPHLLELDVSKNQFDQLPEDFPKMLTELKFHDNKFKDKIFPKIKDMVYLTSIDFSQNKINSEFPDMSTLLNLTYINFKGNTMTTKEFPKLPGSVNSKGEIDGKLHGYPTGTVSPLETINFENEENGIAMQKVDEDCKGIQGDIPNYIQNYKNLEQLQLINHCITGDLPPWIGSLTNLVSLAVMNNKIKGKIPKQVGNLGQLVVLGLRYNNFSGSIPTEVNNLVKLTDLFINENPRLGSKLPQLSGLTKLTAFDTSNCAFEGPLPDKLFTNMKALTYVNFALEKGKVGGLTGNIPLADLISLPKIEKIDFSNNKFSAVDDISSKSSATLTNLVLANNNITAPVTKVVGSFSKLQYFDISTNSFSASFPAVLTAKFPNLEVLKARENKLSGAFPSQIIAGTHIVEVDVGKNADLSGTLPDLPTTSKLERLDIGNTKFASLTISAGYKKLVSITAGGLKGVNLDSSIFMSETLETVIFDNTEFMKPPAIPNDGVMKNLRILKMQNTKIDWTIPDAWYCKTCKDGKPIKDGKCALKCKDDKKDTTGKCVENAKDKNGREIEDMDKHSTLSLLDLSQNNLKGAFPTFMLNEATCPGNIDSLDLSYNPSFTEGVALDTDKSIKPLLKSLDVQKTSRTGAISQFQAADSNGLSILKIGDNEKLTGDLKDCKWANLDKLSELNMANLPNVVGCFPAIFPDKGKQNDWATKCMPGKLSGNKPELTINVKGDSKLFYTKEWVKNGETPPGFVRDSAMQQCAGPAPAPAPTPIAKPTSAGSTCTPYSGTTASTLTFTGKLVRSPKIYAVTSSSTSHLRYVTHPLFLQTISMNDASTKFNDVTNKQYLQGAIAQQLSTTYGCGNVKVAYATNVLERRLNMRQLAITSSTLTFTVSVPILQGKSGKALFDDYSKTLTKSDTATAMIKSLANNGLTISSIKIDSLLQTSSGSNSGGTAPTPAPVSANSNGVATKSDDTPVIGGAAGGVILIAALVAYWYFYMRKPAVKESDAIPSMSQKIHRQTTMDNPMMNPNSRDSIPLFVPVHGQNYPTLPPLSADASKRQSTWDSPSGDSSRLDINNPMQANPRLSQAVVGSVNASALYANSRASAHIGSASPTGSRTVNDDL